MHQAIDVSFPACEAGCILLVQACNPRISNLLAFVTVVSVTKHRAKLEGCSAACRVSKTLGSLRARL